jgi:hypothetical protein
MIVRARISHALIISEMRCDCNHTYELINIEQWLSCFIGQDVGYAIAKIQARRMMASSECPIRASGRARIAQRERNDVDICFGYEQIKSCDALNAAPRLDHDARFEETDCGA